MFSDWTSVQLFRLDTRPGCLYVRILWRSVSETVGEQLTFLKARWPGTSHICGIRTHNPKFALIVYGILLKIILFNSTEHNLELNQISYGKEKSRRYHSSIIFFILNFSKKYDIFFIYQCSNCIFSINKDAVKRMVQQSEFAQLSFYCRSIPRIWLELS